MSSIANVRFGSFAVIPNDFSSMSGFGGKADVQLVQNLKLTCPLTARSGQCNNVLVELNIGGSNRPNTFTNNSNYGNWLPAVTAKMRV